MASAYCPSLVAMGWTHCLVSLKTKTGGQEDAGCQRHVAHTLAQVVQLCRVQVMVAHGYGAHHQAGQQEDEVRQAEGEQEMIEHWGHHLLGQHNYREEITNNSYTAGDDCG